MIWAQILVIILSVFLAIFLILAIVLTVILIKVSRQIKNVTGLAERTAVKLENVASNVAAATTPVVLAKVLATFIKRVRK